MADKKTKKGNTAKAGVAIVSAKVGSYEKHPFFVKKKQQAKAFLQKAGLPPILVKKTS